MSRRRFRLKAWASWHDVAAGRLARYEESDDREALLKLREELPFPIIDVVELHVGVIAHTTIPYDGP